MRAAFFDAVGKPLTLRHIDTPIPGHGQVLIKVARCGICGSDISMTSGSPFDFPLGCTMGHEYAGEVVAVGTGVQYLREGDRISAMPMAGCGQCRACLQGRPVRCQQLKQMMGGFGEYTLAAEQSAIKLPTSVSLSDGALVEPLACGLRAVNMAAVTPGSRILVVGAGPIGMAITYWARLAGASNITVSARRDLQQERAMTMGASKFVTTQQLNESGAAINADIVFECSGATGMVSQAINWAAIEGTVVFAGMCSHPASFIPAIANYKEVTLRFAMAYSLSDFQAAVNAFERGHVEPRAMISDTISLDQLPEQIEAMRQSHPHCKVMVNPWG